MWQKPPTPLLSPNVALADQWCRPEVANCIPSIAHALLQLVFKETEVFRGEDTKVSSGDPDFHSALGCRADPLSEMACRWSAVRMQLWILAGYMGVTTVRKELCAAGPRVWGEWWKLDHEYGEK